MKLYFDKIDRFYFWPTFWYQGSRLHHWFEVSFLNYRFAFKLKTLRAIKFQRELRKSLRNNPQPEEK